MCAHEGNARPWRHRKCEFFTGVIEPVKYAWYLIRNSSTSSPRLTSGVAAYAAHLNRRIISLRSPAHVKDEPHFLTSFLKRCHKQYICCVVLQQFAAAVVIARSASVKRTCVWQIHHVGTTGETKLKSQSSNSSRGQFRILYLSVNEARAKKTPHTQHLLVDGIHNDNIG